MDISTLADRLHHLLCAKDATSDCPAHLRPEYDNANRAEPHREIYRKMAETLLRNHDPKTLEDILETMQYPDR